MYTRLKSNLGIVLPIYISVIIYVNLIFYISISCATINAYMVGIKVLSRTVMLLLKF